LLKTSHKDRRNGVTGKKMRAGLPRVKDLIFSGLWDRSMDLLQLFGK
jgi:hypothetical protein